MAIKDSFTEDEWKTLQWAVLNAGGHVSASDWPGLWKGFKEAAGGSQFLTMLQGSDDELVQELAKDQARRRTPTPTTAPTRPASWPSTGSARPSR